MFDDEPRDERTGWERGDLKGYTEPPTPAMQERARICTWLRGQRGMSARLIAALIACIEAGDHLGGS